MRLAGKVALVTGAQQGIGKAIALAYGREGASVVINYLDNQAAAEEIASQIRALGQRACLLLAMWPRLPMSGVWWRQVRAWAVSISW